MTYLGHTYTKNIFRFSSLFIRNSDFIGSPVFLLAKSGTPTLSGPRPVSQPRAHRRRERPARCGHAGRSLATRPQRETGRRNLSTCLINGGAETAAQTGLRQRHKEEAPQPLPPSIDPGPLWLGQRGRGRRRAGTSPILIREEKVWEEPLPACLPHRSLSGGLRASGLGVSRSGAPGGVRWGGLYSRKIRSLPLGPATQMGSPEDPPVCPGRLSLSPWLQAGLAWSLFFYLLSKYLLGVCPKLFPLSSAPVVT